MKLSLNILFLLALNVQILFSQSVETYLVDDFENHNSVNFFPSGWKELHFKKISTYTKYYVDKDNFFVRAISNKSASAIVKEVSINPKEYPIISWKWKVENILEKADALKKSGDDYPARIYIAFAYDPNNASTWEKIKYGVIKKLYDEYPPKGVLNYIWDNKLAIGTNIDNAYTDRAKMIVVESGKEKVGRWIKEERNVYEDYKHLFKEEPPQISFVALMTDTDNTGESAIAYYDDIVFLSQKHKDDLK
jgi:hypothetical protein